MSTPTQDEIRLALHRAFQEFLTASETTDTSTGKVLALIWTNMQQDKDIEAAKALIAFASLSFEAGAMYATRVIEAGELWEGPR